jgi:hypothetical protein
VTDSGAIEIPLLLFQLFFMVAGVAGGVRIVDDIQRWFHSRAESQDA